MKKAYQTIIVGAGTGGLMVGRYLKNALILDKKNEIGGLIRSGEGISCQALERIKIKPNPIWISATVNTIQRIMPNGKVIGKTKKKLGYILDKSAFDKFLASKCLAEIRLNSEVVDIKKENNKWKVKIKDGDIFISDYLIGSDGAGSMVRRQFFKEKLEILPAIQYLVEFGEKLEKNTAKIYLDNEKFPEGYAWIFPKSDHSANVGLGGKGDLMKKFEDFLETVVKKKYSISKLLENRSGAVPFGGIKLKLSSDNILLVGDAAGLADPIFLGGISQAMSSGKIAAECILKNGVHLYESIVKTMPFADPDLLEARKIFYSLPNAILNELGEILEGKSLSSLKNSSMIKQVLLKPNLKKNMDKIIRFFSIWEKDHDYLW